MLRWAQYGFFLIGGLAIGWYLFVWADTLAYQAYQNWRFEHAQQNPSVVGRPYGRGIPLRPVKAGMIPGSSAAGAAIGRISIPRISLSAMVLEGTDNKTLRRAVGHISGSALPGEPGNIGLAGHRDTFFRNLREIFPGDVITLATPEGSYSYRVDWLRVVGPEDTRVLDASPHAKLTLVTCYPFNFVGAAPKRFIVSASEIAPPGAPTP